MSREPTRDSSCTTELLDCGPSYGGHRGGDAVSLCTQQEFDKRTALESWIANRALTPKQQAAEAMFNALKAAELAEAALIIEWADFWDVAPQRLIDTLMDSQAKRNAAIALAQARTSTSPANQKGQGNV